MQIHLIRHGKTRANEQKLYCGATDLPLSEKGVAELLKLKKQELYPGCMGEQRRAFCAATSPVLPDIFFTSGFMRAEQTLDLLYGSVYRTTLPQFAEYHFGDFEMKSYEMLKDQSDYQAWITDETGQVCCPGGDSKQEFTHRIIEGYKLLIENAQKEKDLFVVSHGGVIASIMEYLFPNTRNFYEWQPKPGRGYSLIYASGRLQLYKPI